MAFDAKVIEIPFPAVNCCLCLTSGVVCCCQYTSVPVRCTVKRYMASMCTCYNRFFVDKWTCFSEGCSQMVHHMPLGMQGFERATAAAGALYGMKSDSHEA